MGLPALKHLEIIDDPARAEIAMHPIRRQLLGELAEPNSASGLARRLGMPRQKINYHLRELEREGFLRLVEERPKRNCIERIVQATARSYIVDPGVLGELGDSPEEIRDRFSSTYLLAAAAQIVRDVATLRRRADAVGQRLATLTLQVDVRFASSQAQHEFAEELSTEVARLASKYHDELAVDGRAYRFTLGAHPVITKTEEQAGAEEAAHRARKEK